MSENLTLESIGKACGVSHITVSRALRGSGNVKPETAKRIREYAESIGYRPNPVARSFARSRNGEFHLATSQSIVVPYNEQVVTQHQHPLFWDYVEGAVSAAATKKSSIEVIGFQGGAIEFDFIRALVEEERIAGVLDFGLMPQTIDYLVSRKVPLVSRLHSVHSIDTRKNAVIYPDHIQGYLLAWKYLLNLGHTRFAYIARPNQRFHLNECIAASQLVAEPPIIEKTVWLAPTPTPTSQTIWTAIKSTLGSWLTKESHSVLFCANDEIAQLTIVALTENGISVPQDVSIVGFDDSAASRFCNPPITTIRNPRKEIGAAMLHLLKDIIAGRPNSRNRIEVLPMELVERKSVHTI